MIEFEYKRPTPKNGAISGARVGSTKPLVSFDKTLDMHRRYLTDSPTPARFAALMKQVDQGDIAAMVELADEMESKDSHLQGVANTRRLAITSLDWVVSPDTSSENTELATEAAKFVTSEFMRIRTRNGLVGINALLEHMSLAIGPNIAVSEIIWKDGRILGFVPVPGHRLQQDSEGRIYIEQSMDKIYVDDFTNKFIVHIPNPRAGMPFRVTLTRAQAWCYVIKHYVIADWASYSEIFGMPWRVAKVADGGSVEEVTQVRNMLKNMGPEGWAIFDADVDVTLLESSRGTQPYSQLLDWIEKKQSILYLGQTLTTELGNTGSFAAAKVHDNVRADLLMSDVKIEARMVRESIIRPMIEYRYPGVDMPVPQFKRVILTAETTN